MPRAAINTGRTIQPSMSARACATRAEVTRIIDAKLARMDARLEEQSLLMSSFSEETTAGSRGAESDYQENLEDLNAKYQLVRARFDEFRREGSARWEDYKAVIQSAWRDFEMALSRFQQCTCAPRA